MDANVLSFLELLEKVPYSQKQNISDSINELFPFIQTTDNYQFDQQKIKVLRFLRDLKNDSYIDFPDTGMNEVGYFRVGPDRWFPNGFDISITDQGRKELKKERERKLQEIVHQSAINVNDSIEATNESIRQTNLLILGHAQRQDATLERQTGLIDRQLALVGRQNRLYIYTLILAAINIGLGIAVYKATMNSNADKQSILMLQSQLVTKNKEIKQLQSLKSDTIRYVLHYPKLKNGLK